MAARPLRPLELPLRGTVLIEASAGTGKTYTITTLFVRLLLEEGLAVEEILVVTFTRAATAELRDRVRRRLRQVLAAVEAALAEQPALLTELLGGDPTLAELVERRRVFGALAEDRRRLVAALNGFDDAAIFTIHGFCQRVLQENAFESGAEFDAELVQDVGPMVDALVYDFRAQRLYRAPAVLVHYIHARKNADLSPDRLRRLVYRVLSSSELTLLPSAPTGAAVEVKRWAELFSAAAAQWREARDEVLAIFTDPKLLDGRSYGNKVSAGLVSKMDAVMQRPAEAFEGLFDTFNKFTPALLEQKIKKGATTPQHPFFDTCAELLEVAAAFPAAVLDLQLELAHDAAEALRQRKEQVHALSFDDLLQRLDLGLQQSEVLADKIRRRYRAALIDEFQDTDPIQYRIFSRVFGHGAGPLFLIGDPKQAIYAFRGADIFAYRRAVEDAGDDRYTLDTNRRSDPSLVAATNTLFEQPRLPFVFDWIGFDPVRAHHAADALQGEEHLCAPLRLLFLPRAQAELTKKEQLITKGWMNRRVPRAIAAEIARLLGSGTQLQPRADAAGELPAARAVEPGDIAVLCRKNRQAQAVQAALRELGVPSVFQGDQSVFDTDEAVEVERLLRALADPGDAAALRAALATTPLGVGGTELERIKDDVTAWSEWLARFRRWGDTWSARGFIQSFGQLLEEHAVAARLLALRDGERRLTNVLHLAELLQTAASAQHLGPAALIQWLRRMRTESAARVEVAAEGAQVRLESDARAVKLVTIHKCKGLQYPIVFCPFMWDGRLLFKEDERWPRFHDPELILDLGSPELEQSKARARREAMAENMRLLYVALTRAQHQSVVLWAGVSEGGSSPLGYLLHQPDEGTGDGDLFERTAARVASFDRDEPLRADLERLVAAASGGAGVECSDLQVAAPAPVYAPASPVSGELHCPEAGFTPRGWASASFSSLSSRGAGPYHPARQGYDFDPAPPDQALSSASSTAAPEAEPLLPMHGFPGGSRYGRFIHKVFELLRFEAAGPDQVRALIEATAQRDRLHLPDVEPLVQAVGMTLDSPLTEVDEGYILRQLLWGRRLNEMPFTLPVADAALDRASGVDRLTAGALAAVFADHAARPELHHYTPLLAGLEFTPLAGYLRGVVDLVFEHDGRYFVVDYKSNFLGPRRADYQRARVALEMARHHYYLQYHLYAVALHRHLRFRIPDYNYERRFGGVYYLFLRGMDPADPTRAGVYFDRPPAALIEALDRTLSATGAPGGAP